MGDEHTENTLRGRDLAGLGGILVAGVVGGMVIGLFIDEQAGTTPVGVLIGIAVGVVGAFGVARVLQSLLYEVEATDPIAIGAAALVFIGVTLVACWAPSRRAAAVDPLEALRSE